MAHVAVIVVTHNSAEDLPQCLASISAAADVPPGVPLGSEHVDVRPLSCSVVVVDSASADETLAIARHHEVVDHVVRLEGNQGYAAGVNRGVSAVDADAYVACNPDCRLEPGALVRMVQAVEGGVGLVAPRLVDGRENPVVSLRREPTVRRAFGEALLGGKRASRFRQWGETIPVHSELDVGELAWATGAALLFTRDSWQATEGWDSSFFLYSEETDFALRAKDAGYQLRYVPDAVVRHVGGDQGVEPELWALSAVNRVRAYAKRHGRLTSTAFWLAVVTNELIRAPRHARHRAAVLALLGYVQGVQVAEHAIARAGGQVPA